MWYALRRVRIWASLILWRLRKIVYVKSSISNTTNKMPEFTPKEYENYIKALFGTPPEQGGHSPKDIHEEGSEDIEWRMRELVQELVDKQKGGETLTQKELVMLQNAKKYLRVRVSDYYKELEDGNFEDGA
jgi:hypothetical protein